MYDIIFKTGNSLDRGSLPGEYVAQISYFFQSQKNQLGTLWTARFSIIHVKNISNHVIITITNRMQFLKLPKEIRNKILAPIKERFRSKSVVFEL